MLRPLKQIHNLSRKGSFISLILAVTSAATNFLFLIIVTRFLTVKEYGEFAGTWAVISLAGISTAGLQNYATAKASTSLHNLNHVGEKRKSLLTVALKYSFIISSLFFLFLSMFSNSSLEIVMRNGLLAISFPVYTLTSIVLGSILGGSSPKNFYIIGLLLSIFKIFFSMLYLSISKNINGLIFLLLLFQTIFFIFIYKMANHDAPRISMKSKNLKSIPIISITTLFYALAILDVPLFRLHNNSLESGEYAGISAVTKVPLMFLGIINTLIISKSSSIVDLSELKKLERKISMRYFLFLGFLNLIFVILEDFIISIFLGEKYTDNTYFVGQLIAYTGLIAMGFYISLYFTHFTTQDSIKVFLLFLTQIAVMFFADLSQSSFLIIYWIFPILMSVFLHPGLRLRKTSKKI